MILKSPDNPLVKIHTLALCRSCKKYHPEVVLSPDRFFQAMSDWDQKHGHCELEKPGSTEFISSHREIPRGFDDRVFNEAGQGPRWLDWAHNADVKISYVADAAITMDLSALASSTTYVAGRESSSVSNASNLYLDYKISGTFISGTTPTAGGEARLYYVQPTEDTPTWPDVFDGTDSAETVTNTAILDKLVLGWSGGYSTASNITYPVISALTLAQAFGIVPQQFVLFFTHFMTAALKTDAGNTNSFFHKACYETVA